MLRPASGHHVGEQSGRKKMPFLGLGLHILVAIFFAVHAMRTGRQMYWLLILFSFPLLGSVVYFLAEYLPSSRLERGIRGVAAGAARALDPTRELREARQAFDLTPTAQNKIRLAEAMLSAGDTAEAVAQFDQCLVGPFAKDSHIRFGAAKARFLNQQPDKAIELLTATREADPSFRPEEVSVLLAQAHGAAGHQAEARSEFEHAVSRHATVEARVAYAIWALSVGDGHKATQLRAELAQAWKHWPKHARQINRPLLNKVDAALQQARQK
jgi:hypothetical protein